MHMQGTPETMNLAPAYDDVALDVFDFLEARIEACLAAGIARDRLIVDPGIGFAKRGRENQEILRALTLFHGLGCPVLLGLSRKGLGIAKKSQAPGEREPASLAAAHYALSQGVQILRVHDVAATRQAVELWRRRSEEHTSELQSLMRKSYAVFCLKNKINTHRAAIYTLADTKTTKAND